MLHIVLHINQNFCYIISTLFQTEKTLQQRSFTSMEEEEGGMGGGGGLGTLTTYLARPREQVHMELKKNKMSKSFFNLDYNS